MSVQQCDLHEKVPANVRMNYSVKAERQKYPMGVRRKIGNLAEAFNSHEFLSELLACDAAFKVTTGARYCAAINDFFKAVISLETSAGDKDASEVEAVGVAASVRPLAAIKEILDRWFPEKGGRFQLP